MTKKRLIRLIAIMLGCLNMDMDSCIRAYREMSQSVFTPKKRSLNPAAHILSKYKARGRFDSAALEKAVKSVIVSSGRPMDELMHSELQPRCRT